MYPVLGHIETLDVTVRTYPVMLVLAAVAGIVFSVPRLRRIPGIGSRDVLHLIGWGLAGAWLGGRVHHLANLGRFGLARIFVEGRLIELVGVSFHAGGAVIGLVVAAAIVTRRHGLPLGRFGDAIVPGFGVGLALGRFACFLNGCCTGTPCGYFWCVAFPKPTNVWYYHVYRGLVPNDATWSAPVHPLQLYFAAVGLVIATLGFAFDRHKRYEGESALVALLIFSGSNAALETIRGYAPMRRFWYGIPQLTWVAVAMSIVTIVVLFYCEWRQRRPVTPVAEVAT